MQKSIFSLLEKIKAIALEGTYYAKDEYDKKRYEQLLQLVAEEASNIFELPVSEIIQIYKKEAGCITPKVGVDVLISNESGRVLILKRSNNQKWCLPCGWVDLDESIFETANREAGEEVGIQIEPTKFITITNKGPNDYAGFAHQINILVDSKKVSDDTKVTLNHEHTDFKWISQEDSTDNFEFLDGHNRYFPMIFEYLKTKE
jgi:8-oxo-dGTP pyrophosphatase MutT (NUDIX family)